jgi:hypothetical protein
VKTLTREQLQRRKEKAVRFVRDVIGDPDRAAEIEQEDLSDYAERRKIRLSNPQKRKESMPTNKQLQKRIRDLEEENQDLTEQLEAIADIVNPEDDESDDDDTDDTDESEDDARD